jgi:hypothetical protein
MAVDEKRTTSVFLSMIEFVNQAMAKIPRQVYLSICEAEIHNHRFNIDRTSGDIVQDIHGVLEPRSIILMDTEYS